MRRFKSPGQAQRFLSIHSQVHNLFRVGRHLLKARHYRMFLHARLIHGSRCPAPVDIGEGFRPDLIFLASDKLTKPRTGMKKKMLIDDAPTDKAKPDANLFKLVVKAFSLKDKFIHNRGEDIKTIAKRENLTGSYFTRLIRINFLASDIIQAILLGCPSCNS